MRIIIPAMAETGSLAMFTCTQCGGEQTPDQGQLFVTCPYCGSTRINYEAGMVTGQKYKCDECNYIGSLIFEKDVEIEDEN